MTKVNAAVQEELAITGAQFNENDVLQEFEGMEDVEVDEPFEEGSESVEDILGPASSESSEELATETPQLYTMEIDGEEREFTVDELNEMYRGYQRQEDYTRKTQQMAEWYRQNEDRLRAVEILDMWMQTYPDKAAEFHNLLFGATGQPQEQVQPQPQPQYQQPVQQEVIPENYAEWERYLQQQQPVQQQPQQQQYTPQQMQMWWGQVRQAQEIQKQREDLELDYALRDLHTRLGDYDEDALLHYMHINKVYNPEVALHALRGSTAASHAAQPVRSSQVATPRRAVVEASRTSGARGVKATMPSKAQGPVRTRDWDEAHKLALAEYGD